MLVFIFRATPSLSFVTHKRSKRGQTLSCESSLPAFPMIGCTLYMRPSLNVERAHYELDKNGHHPRQNRKPPLCTLLFMIKGIMATLNNLGVKYLATHLSSFFDILNTRMHRLQFVPDDDYNNSVSSSKETSISFYSQKYRLLYIHP